MGKKFKREHSCTELPTCKVKKSKKHKKNKSHQNDDIRKQLAKLLEMVEEISDDDQIVCTAKQRGHKREGRKHEEPVSVFPDFPEFDDHSFPTGLALSYAPDEGLRGRTLHDDNPLSLFRPKKFKKAELKLSPSRGVNLHIELEDL